MTNPLATKTVPVEFSGRWLAWDFDEIKIVAAGDTHSATKQAALDAGETRPVLVKAPLAEVRFIGGHP